MSYGYPAGANHSEAEQRRRSRQLNKPLRRLGGLGLLLGHRHLESSHDALQRLGHHPVAVARDK